MYASPWAFVHIQTCLHTHTFIRPNRPTHRIATPNHCCYVFCVLCMLLRRSQRKFSLSLSLFSNNNRVELLENECRWIEFWQSVCARAVYLWMDGECMCACVCAREREIILTFTTSPSITSIYVVYVHVHVCVCCCGCICVLLPL